MYGLPVVYCEYCIADSSRVHRNPTVMYTHNMYTHRHSIVLGYLEGVGEVGISDVHTVFFPRNVKSSAVLHTAAAGQ